MYAQLYQKRSINSKAAIELLIDNGIHIVRYPRVIVSQGLWE